MHGRRLGEETEPDGKQFFNGLDLASIHKKQDHVIIFFHHDVTVCDEYVITADNGADGHALGQCDFVEASTHHL